MMKNKTTKNLIILGAIVFSFAFANNAFAYTCNGYYCYTNPSNGYSADYNPNVSSYNNYNNQNYYQQPVNNYRNYPTNYRPAYSNSYDQGYGTYNSNNNSNNVYYPNNQNTQTVPPVVNNYYPTTTRVVTSTTPSTTTTNTTNNTTTPVSTTPAVEASNPNGSVLGASAAGITALSLRGSGSFMPSSIWQWILVIILILTIIIIARIMIRKSQESKLIQETHVTH